MTTPVKIWRNQKKLIGLIGKKGKLISWTIIRVPPANFEDQAPYPVALIRLEDKKTIIAQVADFVESDLKFGQKVEIVIRRRSQPEASEVIPYCIKAKPI
jgi:uncharacterized protein